MAVQGDPYADRRMEEDRRHDGGWSTLLKVLGSPVSIMVLLGSLVLGTIKVVQQANGALPRKEFIQWKSQDSLVRFYNARNRDNQFIALQAQIADLKAEVSAGFARTDSQVRPLRRAFCRQNPDGCP